MTAQARVFTPASLDAVLEAAASRGHTGSILALPRDVGDLVTQVSVGDIAFVVHASDGPQSQRVVFADPAAFERIESDFAFGETSLQRAHRMVLSAQRMPLRLPPTWSPYQHKNLVAFFAVPREMGALRWVAEVNHRGSHDICFWRMTSPNEPVELARFRAPGEAYLAAVSRWDEALEQAAKRFARRQRRERTGVTETIDLDATTFGAVTGHLPYSAWLERMTDEQLRFLEKPATTSTRLRGPAGSGKTLLLELKALRELYLARSQDRPVRLLFVTHSWAMAEQIDSALRSLDESGDLEAVEVLPLLAIAQDILPAERQGRGFELLGDDNLSGKKLQLQELERIVTEFCKGDWLAFESRSGAAFAERVTAQPGSPERNALIWDLMHEFACVLSAHGILPGVNAARLYLPLQRMPWMMPLKTDGEKLAVLEIYTGFVASLREEKLLTSDQLINDFLNYLETFAWNLRRAEDGYDILCIDELHLFNEQERLTLHYLSRDPENYPLMFMALDPRQSPSEAYATSGIGRPSTGDSGEADATLGRVDSVDLKTVHRFSPEILHLVRHINDSFPALDLGDEWAFGDDVETAVDPTGRKPTLHIHRDRPSEINGALRAAAERASSRAGQERVAVVLVDALASDAYAEAAAGRPNLTLIQGRDDIQSLQYSRRSIALGAAEYLAGLQFGTVVVAGLPADSNRTANLGHQRRRLLSLLYLAISRATTDVEIHVNTEAGGVPEILETALETGVLETRPAPGESV